MVFKVTLVSALSSAQAEQQAGAELGQAQLSYTLAL